MCLASVEAEEVSEVPVVGQLEILRFARSRVKATLDAHRTNFQNGEATLSTWEKHRRKLTRKLSEIDWMIRERAKNVEIERAG